ncbi:DUF2164 domain-containing protein [Thalassotalea sp. 1_MG-2023]|uniref:DUF2164 domain-containing protein n=1 Tax=Thalassotalea sp. 1_MG-2023 TaxID=3062680 RepID=UPI0026E36EA3|nr:DUF2164 domain-containing protein [Thalassotalea sp. 1_MG-2023]MDO6427457.1 DUF2164 domain-containing protein [Thalassotalea sp. 1_MG-2023]
MANITLSDDAKHQLINKLQHYFEQELSIELGQFDADFLLDFIGDNFGSYFYNQGLYDAQHIINEKIDHISETLYELEKPTT